MSNTIILIPAYKPDELMLPFLCDLRSHFDKIVVVDDGGGEKYRDIFKKTEQLGIDVVTHAINLGKGRAIKTGLNFLMVKYPDASGMVIADCDGQHSVKDIIRVVKALEEHPDRVIIGGRAFDGDVPFRSKFGNTAIRYMYKVATGMKIYDTQTGLRGFSRDMFPKLLSLRGERYEYEMDVLLKLREFNVKPYEIKIQTIYLNNNASSHYSPIRDSLRICARVLSFAFASVLSFILDYGLFALFLSLISTNDVNIFGFAVTASSIAFGGARIISSFFNYLINRNIVFGGNCNKSCIFKYYALVIVVMLLGMFVMKESDILGVPYLIKIIYDTVMFIINYFIQRDFVFSIKSK